MVEEIGLTYTFIRADDDSRLVIPNEKLASDTIRNSTIVSREKLAEITVQVPLDRDSARWSTCCAGDGGRPPVEVLVTALNERATITCATWRTGRDGGRAARRATCACASHAGCAPPRASL